MRLEEMQKLLVRSAFRKGIFLIYPCKAKTQPYLDLFQSGAEAGARQAARGASDKTRSLSTSNRRAKGKTPAGE
jgi:hypothetical protein